MVCFFESLIWVLCFKCSKSLTSSIRGDLICSLVVLGFCCAASVVLGPVFLIVAVIFIVQVTFYFLNKPVRRSQRGVCTRCTRCCAIGFDAEYLCVHMCTQAIDLCIQLVTESAEVALESPGFVSIYRSSFLSNITQVRSWHELRAPLGPSRENYDWLPCLNPTDCRANWLTCRTQARCLCTCRSARCSTWRTCE